MLSITFERSARFLFVHARIAVRNDKTDFPSLNLLKVPGYDFFLASSLLATRPSPSHSFVLVLVSSGRGVSDAC